MGMYLPLASPQPRKPLILEEVVIALILVPLYLRAFSQGFPNQMERGLYCKGSHTH